MELQTEKDEIKESIKEIERKKNFTQKPKNISIYKIKTDFENKNKNIEPKI